MIERIRARRLGAMLRCAPNEDDSDAPFADDPVANILLRRLVPNRILDRALPFDCTERLRILLVLSYATRFLMNTTRVLDNLERRQNRTQRPLSLAQVLAEIGLLTAGDERMGAEVSRERFRRYGGAACQCDPNTLEPDFESAGYRLAEQLGPEPTPQITHRADYLAAVFTNATRVHLGDSADSARQLQRAGALWAASRAASEALAQLHDVGIEDDWTAEYGGDELLADAEALLSEVVSAVGCRLQIG